MANAMNLESMKKEMLIFWWNARVGLNHPEEFKIYLEALSKRENDVLNFIFINNPFAKGLLLSKISEGSLDTYLEGIKEDVLKYSKQYGDDFYNTRREFIKGLMSSYLNAELENNRNLNDSEIRGERL